MTDESAGGPAGAPTDSDLAVRVRGVTKTYGIWSSPKARLAHPLMTMGAQILPFSRLARSLEHRTQHMYRDFHALHEVSLDIRKGESWGFIGVNGSGKSTLLKIISGNLRPSSGWVEVDGKVAILDYGAGFNGEFTGRENVYLKASILGLTHRQIDERFDSIAAFADIGEFIDQPVKTYSSGMGARLGFAIMAHVDADIMITDEALAVGDAFFVQKCMRHIRSFLTRGTFLFVSHSINDIMSLCTKAVWLDRGQVIKIGTSKEVCEAYATSIARRSAEVAGAVRRPSDDDALLPASEHGDSEAEPILREDEVEDFPRGRRAKTIRLGADDLAALKNHYAPRIQRPPVAPVAQIEVREAPPGVVDKASSGLPVGGGRIFGVTITDDQMREIPVVIGGEIVNLTIRAVAENELARPLVGFQLKNHLGLTLVGENTEAAMTSQELCLRAGDVISARFRFSMPLLSPGEYVIGVSLYDGHQDDGATPIDVVHDALLLRCQTSGDRHGLVGVPLLGLEITREPAPHLP